MGGGSVAGGSPADLGASSSTMEPGSSSSTTSRAQQRGGQPSEAEAQRVVDEGLRHVPASVDAVHQAAREDFARRVQRFGCLDYDGAGVELGKSLGAFPESTTLRDVKWVLWSDNPLGNRLVRLVTEVTERDPRLFLDKEEQQVRWLG